MSLDNQIKELEDVILYHNQTNHKVSTKNVGWHIDHAFRVIIAVTHALKQSNPRGYRYSFHWGRQLMLLTGSIARGKAKAPRMVIAKRDVNSKSLEVIHRLTKEAFTDLQKLDPKAHFRHQYIGRINTQQSIRFLEIHTKHHLKIIQEILA
jgi:hypothetical protein